jgi:hypothetical protein
MKALEFGKRTTPSLPKSDVDEFGEPHLEPQSKPIKPIKRRLDRLRSRAPLSSLNVKASNAMVEASTAPSTGPRQELRVTPSGQSRHHLSASMRRRLAPKADNKTDQNPDQQEMLENEVSVRI